MNIIGNLIKTYRSFREMDAILGMNLSRMATLVSAARHNYNR